ncbi:MAG: type ISP restriction/modification enzyme [Paludibacteraceae bacterium]|nr:type ISP restriction/modification enzyme [Paludibacteraceae bacterium]
MTFQDILNFCRSSFTEKEKGTKFEKIMCAWLKTDPRFNELQSVWMWEDFPSRKDFGGKDIGIDLVARTETGDYWAIQCKCYAEMATIDKPAVDSFLSTSAKAFTDPETLQTVRFAHRVWISTTNHWGTNAEQAIQNQNPPVTRINLADLTASAVDWEQLYNGIAGTQARTAKKQPLEHQRTAIEKARQHFIEQGNDRGKLIMACGTGKTYTSLKTVEALLNNHGLVLFLVPSISLLGQTLNEWSADAEKPIKAICICSDSTASRNRKKDDDDPTFSAIDLALPATTDPRNISKQLRRYRNHDGLVVVFSTYQSIEAVFEAQQQILLDTNGQYGTFDFIVCDEAHRTTGATKKGDEDSNFSKIHEADYIRGNKRLYMTATPRIYSDTTKAQATEKDFILYSMDNEEWYGKEYFHVGFGYAVEHQLLTDYKVFVMTVSESDIPNELQRKIKNADNKELSFDDVSKLIGVISGLSKIIKGDDNRTWEIDPRTMRRALAFCSSIGNVSKPGSSKNVAEVLPKISQFYQDLRETLAESGETLPEHVVSVVAQHVDGSMNSVTRAEALRWLADEPETPNECRVITNVRCLSEGVDVPALDAVLFLSARNSQVDIVQSVGRVMRNFRRGTADEKKYGYIIIPVVVPDNAEPDAILESNDFKTVWSILNALRSHDDRFNAHVNKINLNKKKQDKVVIGQQGLGFGTHGLGQCDSTPDVPEELTIDFGEYENVIYAKLVDKVGDRMYWENWAKEVGDIAKKFISRINSAIASGEYAADFATYLDSLRKNINPYVDEQQAIEMLAQHMITKPVFDALFNDYEFVKNNSISSSMERMLAILHADAFEKDTEVLQRFYESVSRNISDIDNLQGKQTIIKNLYEKFFKGAFPTTVEKLGIVYTPVECVDFIIKSVDSLLRKEFHTSLTEKDVHILDPFTGTGTFIARLLQSGLIKPEDLERKYTQEIFCNEIVLLAYYIADVNIEAVFHDLNHRKSYLSFDNICLTDTFQLAEPGSEVPFTEFFKDNAENVSRQKRAPIRVIIGNPPYSIGQKSANDNAQNQSYPTLDNRVANTYTALSSATLAKGSYDSYFKAFRWASDRIPQNEGGIVAYISNGAWLDSDSGEGFRRCLEKEFSSIYVFNLRGNARTSGEQRRKEGGGVFDAGSRTPISITFLVKNPAVCTDKAKIFYHDIGDYLTREQKLKIIADFGSIDNIPWETIVPNDKADWINQRDGVFDTLIPLIDTKNSVFAKNGPAIATGRDVWVYNFGYKNLQNSLNRLQTYYNDSIRKETNIEEMLDSKKISWSRALKGQYAKKKVLIIDNASYAQGLYRPFVKQHLYYDGQLIESPGINRMLFSGENQNKVICVMGKGAKKEHSALIVNALSDYQLEFNCQVFPLYWYEENKNLQATLFDGENTDKYIRHDGITDWILKEIRSRFSNSKEITKERIFYYVYGILHSPEYRSRFADDLKKSLPRIPIVERIEDFITFAKIGKQLADLHLNYEAVAPDTQVTVQFATQPPVPTEQLKTWFALPDGEQLLEKSYDFFAVEKMRFAKVRDDNGKLVDDKSKILYNSNITFENIPLAAYDYIVNGKSAIEWIMERYAITVDGASGIKNDPNDWSREHDNPTYIYDLLHSIISLSIQTNTLVSQLPKLNL